jgi:hypothetical protein
MTLGPKVFGNFRRQTKRPRARDRRDGTSKSYLEKIRQLGSCVSGRSPCVAHHLRCGPAARERGLGLKATDQWAVPLTAHEHTLDRDCVHSVSGRDEQKWFRERGVEDVIALAKALWEARDDFEQMRLCMARLR